MWGTTRRTYSLKYITSVPLIRHSRAGGNPKINTEYAIKNLLETRLHGYDDSFLYLDD